MQIGQREEQEEYPPIEEKDKDEESIAYSLFVMQSAPKPKDKLHISILDTIASNMKSRSLMYKTYLVVGTLTIMENG
jgi:hypothetical protein